MKTDKCRQCGLVVVVGSDGLCPDCHSLKANPDATAQRTKLSGVPFRDMKQVDEADRFKLIADYLGKNRGKNIAVMVEQGGKYQGKGDRYVAEVTKILPKVEAKRKPGLVAGTETIVFKLM